MSASSSAASFGEHTWAPTGDPEVDAILEEFAQAHRAVDTTDALQSDSEGSGSGSDTAELDRLLTVLGSADEAHRRLQERLSAERG